MNKEEIDNKLEGTCQDCIWLEKIEPIFNQLQQENKQLKDKLSKAIEYIKDNACYDENINKCVDDLMYCDCDKLLEILKGENNE